MAPVAEVRFIAINLAATPLVNAHAAPPALGFEPPIMLLLMVYPLPLLLILIAEYVFAEVTVLGLVVW